MTIYTNLKLLCLIKRWTLFRETGDGYESFSGLYSSKCGGLITSEVREKHNWDVHNYTVNCCFVNLVKKLMSLVLDTEANSM